MYIYLNVVKLLLPILKYLSASGLNMTKSSPDDSFKYGI